MNTECIRDLDVKVHGIFIKLGYSKSTRERMLAFTRKMVLLHCQQGDEELDINIIDEFIKEQEKLHLNGKISKGRLNDYRRFANYLVQIYGTGDIVHKRICKKLELPDCFITVIDNLANNKEEWSIKHRQFHREYAVRFFRWLYLNGSTDLSGINENSVKEYLIKSAGKMTGASLDVTRRMLKQMLMFLYKTNTLPHELNKLFIIKIPIEKRLQPFIPQDNIAAVLGVIDTNTAIGKRDYAMIILAAITGLRGVDILNLTLDGIDWSTGELKITQTKTGVSLALPLTTDVGIAIRDYIENARPQSSSNTIFLSTRVPFGEMSRRSIGIRFSSYCIKADLRSCGFHSLRRSIATNMVTTGTSVITVSQTLGHSSINSTKQYISLDSLNLKKCALNFIGIAMEGGVKE